jgi:hypothetical protein
VAPVPPDVVPVPLDAAPGPYRSGERASRCGTVHHGLDALVLQQITGHVLDAVRRRVGVAAEHPHHGARVAQPRDDVAPECARAAGDQNA